MKATHYVGEKVWEAFARPCLEFSEYLEENADKAKTVW